MIYNTDKFHVRDDDQNIVYAGSIGDYIVSANGNEGPPGPQGATGGLIDTMTFKMLLTSPQAVIKNDWRTIEFTNALWKIGEPNFDQVNFLHDTSNPTTFGLWYYEVKLMLDVAQSALLRAYTASPALEIFRIQQEENRVHMSFLHYWTGVQDEMVIHLNPSEDCNVLSNAYETYFAGARLSGLGVADPTSGEFNGQVQIGTDDAHENDASSGFSHTGVTLKVESDSDAVERWNCGVRFQDVGIPQSATIDFAELEVVFPANQRDSPRLVIYGHKVVDSDDFATEADVTSRARTAASVSWSADNLSSGVFIASPDIKTVIQEIVNQVGWSQGNALTVICVGDDTDDTEDCRFTPYNATPANACKLNIEWST